MLDAICTFDEGNPVTYSIFEFKRLPATEIDKLRYSLLCPVCRQKAYFRRASKDGRQACFGSRYHKQECSEFNPSARKTEEEKQVAEVENILLKEAYHSVIILLRIPCCELLLQDFLNLFQQSDYSGCRHIHSWCN